MLVVTDINQNTEILTDVQGVEINEEVNADFSISFTSFFTEKNAHSYPLLQEESIIELDGHEYRVKQMSEVGKRKSVTAPHIFFDLIDDRQDEIISGTKTANEIFTFILAGTGWTFQIGSSITSQSFVDFGNKNVLELIRKACDIFDCEIKIETGKRLTIQPKIGVETDEQFRYKHNIKTLKREVDTSNLTTCIKGTGAVGIVVVYKSPNVSKYGERWAEPISDERFTNVSSLEEHLKRKIQDVPEVSIDLEVISLGINVSLGDKVWTIYEPLGLEFQTRVMAIKSYPFTNKSPVIELTNRKKTVTDFLADTKQEIDDNKEEIEKELDEAEKRFKSKLEQTDDRITLEVEEIDKSIASLNIKADNINMTVNNRITNEVAAINIQANNISLAVQRVDERLGTAEGRIDIQAGQIQSKVSTTDYNGYTIKSLITQTPTTVQIDARHIALRGEVTSDNIQVGNEIRLGYSSWNSVKSLIFNDSTYLSADGDRLDIYASNNINFYATTAFRGGVEGVVASRSDQRVNVSFDSDLTMNVTVNGRTARFKPV